jgi:hypothetical protein
MGKPVTHEGGQSRMYSSTTVSRYFRHPTDAIVVSDSALNEALTSSFSLAIAMRFWNNILIIPVSGNASRR